MREIDAWRCFNMGDGNQDPGGSWLYALRYDVDSLSRHQDTLIGVMVDMGVTIYSNEDGLALGSERQMDEAEIERITLLAEELTVTNEALESARLGLYGKTIADLADLYKVTFLHALATGNKELSGGILRTEMPQLVSDLSRAQMDNEPLSPSDYAEVEELADFVIRKTAILMEGDSIVTISNFAAPQSLSVEDLPEY